MTNDEYETAIGKLMILKLFLTKPHRDTIDGVIEELEAEYLKRRGKNEL